MDYEYWAIKKYVAEKGVDREEISRWAIELKGDKKDLYRAYLDAGIKKFSLVQFCVNEKIPLEEVFKKKQSFMEEGMDEKTAEEWLELFFREPKLTQFLWGKDLELVRSLVFAKETRKEEYPSWIGVYVASYDEKITLEDVQKFLGLLKEYGIEEDLALQELRYFAERKWLAFKENKQFNEEFVRTALEEAKGAGFKSLLLWLKLGREYKDRIEKARKRKDFHMALGLDEVRAEWWAMHEALYHKEFSQEDKEVLFSLKTPLDIERFFDVLFEMRAKDIKGNLKDASEWAKKELFLYLGYTSLEVAKEWAEFRLLPSNLEKLPEDLSPQEFRELLKESHCGPDELFRWIKAQGLDEVKKWFELGVKDWRTCVSLKDGGVTLDKLSDFRRLMTIETVLKIFSERSLKGLEEEERAIRNKVQSKVVKVFKRR